MAERRDRVVKVLMTEAEYGLLAKAAGSEAVSGYCRRILMLQAVSTKTEFHAERAIPQYTNFRGTEALRQPEPETRPGLDCPVCGARIYEVDENTYVNENGTTHICRKKRGR